MALEWVKLNIAAFGGDPNAVTVLGYRAGATLVTALASSPSSKGKADGIFFYWPIKESYLKALKKNKFLLDEFPGLMKRVWVTSGSADFPGRPLSESENDAAPFLEKLRNQCNDKKNSTCKGSYQLILFVVLDSFLEFNWIHILICYSWWGFCWMPALYWCWGLVGCHAFGVETNHSWPACPCRHQWHAHPSPVACFGRRPAAQPPFWSMGEMGNREQCSANCHW